MDSKRVEEIYDMLQSMKIELAANTTLVDSAYLTTTLAKCDDYIQKTDDVLTEVLREIGALERKISDQNDIYDAMFQETLQKDPEVKALGTGAERANATKFKLRVDSKAIKGMDADLRDLQTIQKVIERKSKRLSSAIVSVKKQWDSNIDSAKYLNLHPREYTADTVFTSNQPYEDPTIKDLVEHEISEENKLDGTSTDAETPIIDEKPEEIDAIADILDSV